MNPSSTAPIFNDYRQRSTNVRSKILKNEEQRMQLEQKLRTMASSDSRSHQRRQIQHIQTYFTRLNQESQRAEQRNLNLLNDLTHAQENLDKLHHDAQHLTRLKNDYLTYLESNYPNWQKPTSTGTSTNIDSSNEYDRLARHMKQQDHLESDGNLRRSVPIVRQSYDVDSSMLFKRYEDQLKVGLDRTISPSTPMINNEIKDEQSISEANTVSHVKRNGSLRMELNRPGLYFLLDYIEQELKDTIDKKKIYRLDPPTITQTRTILDIANDRQRLALKDLDLATTSMVILDQLPSTIRRTTINKCLLTEDILSSNIKDLSKDIIAQRLPEEDRSLWLRLIDHFSQLLKLHVMNSQTLANKFALTLLPSNVIYAHEKARSLLQYILEKLLATQSSSSDDESSLDKQTVQHIVKTNPTLSSSWLNKVKTGAALNDDDDNESSPSSSSTIKKNMKSKNSRANTTKDNSDQEFFS